jgi:hypothetical protein
VKLTLVDTLVGFIVGAFVAVIGFFVGAFK